MACKLVKFEDGDWELTSKINKGIVNGRLYEDNELGREFKNGLGFSNYKFNVCGDNFILYTGKYKYLFNDFIKNYRSQEVIHRSKIIHIYKIKIKIFCF